MMLYSDAKRELLSEPLYVPIGGFHSPWRPRPGAWLSGGLERLKGKKCTRKLRFCMKVLLGEIKVRPAEEKPWLGRLGKVFLQKGQGRKKG